MKETLNMGIQIDKELIENNVSNAVCVAIASALGDKDELIRKAVKAVVSSYVDTEGRPCRNGDGYVARQMTLCWQCANAVPDKSGKRGCAWSRSFKPVKGWDADETRLYANDETRSIVSYHVRSCPEFVEG